MSLVLVDIVLLDLIAFCFRARSLYMMSTVQRIHKFRAFTGCSRCSYALKMLAYSRSVYVVLEFTMTRLTRSDGKALCSAINFVQVLHAFVGYSDGYDSYIFRSMDKRRVRCISKKKTS